MGQYTEGRATVTFKTKEAKDRACDEVLNISNLYKVAEGELQGACDYHQIDEYDCTVDIDFSSSRYANAEWQGEVVAYVLAPFKDDIQEMWVNLTQPYTEMAFHCDEEEDIHEFFEDIIKRVKK